MEHHLLLKPVLMRPCLDYSSVTVSELEDKVAMLEGGRGRERGLSLSEGPRSKAASQNLLPRVFTAQTTSSNSVQITIFSCHLCQTEQSGLAVICRQQCQGVTWIFSVARRKIADCWWGKRGTNYSSPGQLLIAWNELEMAC